MSNVTVGGKKYHFTIEQLRQMDKMVEDGGAESREAAALAVLGPGAEPEPEWKPEAESVPDEDAESDEDDDQDDDQDEDE